MDLSKIGYFFKAAELQNVTQAAKACHLSQTSMSKYLSNLERETGVLLFDRKKNRLILNENGSRFYQEMKKIDETYRNLCQSLRQNRTSRLNLGVVTSDYSEFDLIEGFERTQEDIQVFFTFCQEDQAVSRLQQKVVDALILPDMICRELLDSDEYECMDLVTTPVSLVCSSALFEQCGSVKKLLETMPLITKTEDPAYHDRCLQALSAQFQTEFSSVKAVDSYSEQILLLAMSRGFSVLPGSLIHESGHLISPAICQGLEETQKLVYPAKEKTVSLIRLIEYIHENKC